MGKRLLAAVIGGLVMFVWGAISHAVLPTGQMGYSQADNEAAVLAALQKNLGDEAGLFMMPWMDSGADEETMQAQKAAYEAGPYAWVVYDPEGQEAMSMETLVTELATNIVAAMLVVFVLAGTSTGFFGRVIASTLFGVVGWLSISASHWSWFRFPKDFMLAEGIEQTVGWFLVGLVLAKMVPRKG